MINNSLQIGYWHENQINSYGNVYGLAKKMGCFWRLGLF